MTDKQALLSTEILQLQDAIEENFTDSLLKLSYKYLDQYYLQVREHSNRSFWLTMGFSAVGGLVLLAGVAGLLFFQRGTEAYLTAAAGLITNLISAVFFYLYNKSVREMQTYYDRLVLAQNLAVSIKAAQLLPDEELTKRLGEIISQLMRDYNKIMFEQSRQSKEDPDPAPREEGGDFRRDGGSAATA